LQYYDLTRPEEVQAAHRRFEAEGRTLAQLRHPGIPDIIAYFSEGGRNYIVMEYVEGTNLLQGLTHVDAQGNLVRGRPYAIADVLRWGIQICEVLIYLAEQNPPVVHHDIKPANIIVDRTTGEARLVDFGTAKARLVVQPGGRVGVQQSSIYGTEGYAAPEMYQGESSPRSDIYSLGATLYHLLTDDDPSHHPFDFPKLDTLDPPLRAVLRGALQNDPQARPDAKGLKDALKGIQEALSGKAQAPFFFPDGRMARTPVELARLCDERWTVAKDLLYKGDLEGWLRRSLFRIDLANQAAAIVLSTPDPDEGLEKFLHVLNPGLPYPALGVHPRALRFGRIPPGGRSQRTVRVRNRTGRGIIKGTIVANPSVPWLTAPSQFQGEGDITVTVETGNTPTGTPLITQLRLKTAYDEVSIPVRGRVAFPWPRALALVAAALQQINWIGAVTGQHRVQRIQPAENAQASDQVG
ncbi:MAG: serine/threonine protein kinase, partial [Anaerolineae bacterium]